MDDITRDQEMNGKLRSKEEIGIKKRDQINEDIHGSNKTQLQIG